LLLAEDSQENPWVHQHLGYATGLRLPVLPIALGESPGEMFRELGPITLDPIHPDFGTHISARQLDRLVACSYQSKSALFEVADSLFDRSRLLAGHAERIYKTYGPCKVFQRATFGSFAMPSPDSDRVHGNTHDGADHKDETVRAQLRMERLWMERHAREAGCDLMLDTQAWEAKRENPAGPTAAPWLARLREFIQSMPEDKLRVVSVRGQIDRNPTILGDWMAADVMVSRSTGILRQTVVTSHGPTVLARKREFENEFNARSEPTDPDRCSQRQEALNRIEAALSCLDR
jgi:hypothetical protein